jgi:hypothetical protein
VLYLPHHRSRLWNTAAKKRLANAPQSSRLWDRTCKGADGRGINKLLDFPRVIRGAAELCEAVLAPYMACLLGARLGVLLLDRAARAPGGVPRGAPREARTQCCWTIARETTALAVGTFARLCRGRWQTAQSPLDPTSLERGRTGRLRVPAVSRCSRQRRQTDGCQWETRAYPYRLT